MSTDDPSGTLQRLWGQQPRPRRGPKPALSVEQIVESAFELAVADGLDAVSMSRVAKTLGYSPMALYRHVNSKDELLVLLADRVADLMPEMPDGLGWREGLEHWTRSQIQMALDHPWILELPLTTSPPGPRRLRALDQAMGAMASLDISFDAKLGIIGLLSQHVLGEARVQVETRRAAIEQVRRTGDVDPDLPDDALDAEAVDQANPYYDFEAVLSGLAGPEDAPHIFAAVADWSPPAPVAGIDENIDFGLSILLDGVEVFVRRHSTRP